MPFSPSMNVIADRHDAVAMKAGSYVINPKSSSSVLILRNSVARMVPSSIGISYCLPVRLSVTVRVSPDVATPLPFAGGWVELLLALGALSGRGVSSPARRADRPAKTLVPEPHRRYAFGAGRAR